MEASLQKQFDSLETRKQQFLEILAAWDTEHLSFQPASSAWCALHVLDHVVKTEAAILNAMQSRQAARMTVPLPDRTRGWLLTLLFLTPAQVKAPASVQAIVPGARPDLAALTETWTGTRLELAAFLAPFTRQQLPLAIFQHPVAGWMSLPRTLSFLHAHIVHHRFQLRRLHDAGRTRPAS